MSFLNSKMYCYISIIIVLINITKIIKNNLPTWLDTYTISNDYCWKTENKFMEPYYIGS